MTLEYSNIIKITFLDGGEYQNRSRPDNHIPINQKRAMDFSTARPSCLPPDIDFRED